MTLFKYVMVFVALSIIELCNSSQGIYTKERSAFDKNDFDDPEEKRYEDGEEVPAMDLPLIWNKEIPVEGGESGSSTSPSSKEASDLVIFRFDVWNEKSTIPPHKGLLIMDWDNFDEEIAKHPEGILVIFCSNITSVLCHH